MTRQPLVPNDDMKRKWVATYMADAKQRRTPGGIGTLEPASLDPVNARLASVHYFDAWHRVTFGDELALMPIAPEVLLQFIVNHTEGLTKEAAEAIKLRRKQRSDGRSYPATIDDRVRHISEAHNIAGFDDPADHVQVRMARRASRS